VARGTPYRFSRFGRGLNVSAGPYSLREGYVDDPSGLGAECRDLMNVTSRRRGNVCRRDGCVDVVTLSPSTPEINGLSVIGQDASSFAVISTSDGDLRAVSSAVPSVVSTLVLSGLSTSAPWRFVRAPVQSSAGPAWGMNGVDTPRWTTGAGSGAAETNTWVASTGTVPNGSLLTTYENSLFVSGVAAYPYRVYWSYPGEPLHWPTASVVDLGKDSADPITAIVSLGPNLLVFKERGIWVIYDSETGANRKIADNVGTLSPESVVATEQGCFFLDPQQGVMVTDGAAARPVSLQIATALNGLTITQLSSASASFIDAHLYLSVQEGSTRVVYDYDTVLNSWWKHSPTVSHFAVWDRGVGPRLIGVNAVKGQVLELFRPGELLDDGAVFSSWWTGPFHTFNAPHLRKRTRRIHLDGRGTLDVYVAVDYDVTRGEYQATTPFSASADASVFGGAGTFGGSGSFAQQVTIGEDVIYTSGIGRSFSIGLYSSAGQYWELDAYTMLMTQMRN
jgi:hypothetical protein